jgi:hypothetical protein
MTDFLLHTLASALGFLIATYIHGFIFAMFRADKYEDVLAEKVAKRVKDEAK